MRKDEIDPQNDDEPVGRLLTRREVLALLGGAGSPGVDGFPGGRPGGNPPAGSGAAPTATATSL